MSATITNQYLPDSVPPPGESLHDTLEGLGMSQKDFAKRMGLSEKHISKIISGEVRITPETALGFEKVLGVPARFWSNLEMNYQDHRARMREAETLKEHLSWASNFPAVAMAKRKFIPETKAGLPRVRALLEFFGIAGVPEWEALWKKPEVAFRASAKRTACPHALSAWLRAGERMAQQFSGPAYDVGTFQSSLSSIRAAVASPPENIETLLTEHCSRAGVALHLVPELPKLAVCGACFWQSNHPVILLNLYHNSEDHFWFNFFHEAKHVLQGLRKRLFVDVPGDAVEDEKEVEANAYAADTLIPRRIWNSFCAKGDFSRQAVTACAKTASVPPGILVGQLQHHRLLDWATPLNAMKRRFVWD